MSKFKDRVISLMPDPIFVGVAGLRGVEIEKVDDFWMITKDGVTLASPEPKFIGFGMSAFRTRFEKYFNILSGDTVLDVGACIGDTTVPMAMKVGKTGFVIAVEPHPVNLEYLESNLCAQKVPYEVVGKGAWSSPGTMKLNVGQEATGHSFVWGHSHNWSSSVEVEIDTIENIVGDRTVDFAKLDVQGAEVEVLEGIGGADIRKMVVESHGYGTPKSTHWEIIKAVKSMGYTYELDPVEGNIHAWKTSPVY